MVNEIGYDNGEYYFDGNAVGVIVAMDRQSPDIAQGVDTAHEGRVGGSEDPLDRIGAGDQGMMFGYATNETPEHMPTPIILAHQLSKKLSEVRHSGLLPYLRPDGKTQVTVRYDDKGKPVGIEKVLISTQHQDGVESQAARGAVGGGGAPRCCRGDLYDPARLREEFYVNPTGRFVIGGPVGDTGLTGRKIIVDTYGGFARHGGGAFSGKDPSKVDRSAAYAARYVAKNIVAAGLADRAEVQVAYAIGVARPLSLLIETFGTEKIARKADRRAGQRELRPAPRRDPARPRPAPARSTSRPPPTATSAAPATASPGSGPTRPTSSARRRAWLSFPVQARRVPRDLRGHASFVVHCKGRRLWNYRSIRIGHTTHHMD